jgi:hypothetical protein
MRGIKLASIVCCVNTLLSIFETFDNVATERDLLLADKQQLEIEKSNRDAKLRELGIDPDTL